MSRIVSRSEQEPLMRLQRPSSASSQDTAHLVNACLRHFLENSSTPLPSLDRGRVDNLRVSSADQRGGYHKRYVELLNMVHDEHQRRVREVDQVEKHLMMAKAASLAAEEKKLSPLDQQLGLPKGPCQLPRQLDENLLRQHKLLVPSNYLVTTQPLSSGPKPPSIPSHRRPTITSDQHSKITHDMYIATRRATTPMAPPSSSKQSVLSVSKSGQKLESSSSSVPVSVGIATRGVADIPVGGAGRMIANPTSVVFTDYHPGHTYTGNVQLTNCGSTSRQFSVIQPSTGYFSARVGQFPTSEGSLAPGISCTYIITFCPDSTATFDDCLQVTSHEGVCLSIPVLGRRPQPLLEVSPLPVWYSGPGKQSEDTIICCNTGQGSGSYTIKYKEDHETHFTLSPTTFDLAPDDQVAVKVAFQSDSTGEFTHSIRILCSNGDVEELSLIGCCELSSVGVAGVRPATSQREIEQWDGAPPISVCNDDDDVTPSNLVYDEKVVFDPANPSQTGHCIVAIRNYCHMKLPYHWSLYRPITGSQTQPVPSLNSPYTVKPQSGILAADSTTAFLVAFSPLQAFSLLTGPQFVTTSGFVKLILPVAVLWNKKTWPFNPGHFTDLAQLTLDSTEAIQPVPTIQLHLEGLCEEYDVMLSPGCLVIPGTLMCGVEHSYRIKVVNNSLSSVQYQWQSLCGDDVCMRVEPSEGSIVSSGVGYYEVLMRPLVAGAVSVDLNCTITHRSLPLVMCVRATAEAPSLTIDLPSLNYGLITNGCSKTLQLPVRNDTQVPIKFTLQEVVPSDQLGCLTSVPAEGEVPPHGTMVCTVKCDTEHQPLGEVVTHSSLRTILSCTTDLGVVSCLEVLGEIQSPRVCLRSCELHVNNAYVNIPMDHMITLHNMMMIPAQFNWRRQLYGDGAECCDATISPSCRTVAPRSSCDLTVTVTWNTEGDDLPAAIMCCEVDGMKDPVLLSVTGHVHGLSIHYSIQDGPSDQECLLDFGNTNSLGKAPNSLYLKVTNDTAIPTSLSAHVAHFPSTVTHTDPPATKTEKKTLLNQTANLANPKSMTNKRSQLDLANQVLSRGKGCGFVVTPSELDIPAHSSHMIQLMAYSDMWGVYSDQLVCQVPGLADTSVPISYGVVGSPMLFPTTATYGTTIARFGSHPADSGPVKRTVKLRNTSPCELTVDWEVYNKVPGDKQLIDLIVAVGKPFPVDVTDDEGSCDDDVIPDDVIKGSRDLVKVMIKAHEGVTSSHPIRIHPNQTVIKGYSSASAEVVFTPVIMETGDGSISSYILGRVSITSENDHYDGAVRGEGYDIDPLRIDLTGKSLYPRLSMEFDSDDGSEDEVIFRLTADQFLRTNGEVKSSYFTRRNVNLNNVTDMKLTFDLVTHSPFSCDTSAPLPITLTPHHTTQVCLGYQSTLDEVVKGHHSQSGDPPVITSNGHLTVKYSTGIEQLLSLTSRVFLPVLCVDVDHVKFGATLLNQSTSLPVTVYNNSNCTSQWSLSVEPLEECTSEEANRSVQVFSVSPTCSTTTPHHSSIVTVMFIPIDELEYVARVYIRGVLGDHVSFTVSGSGSADEAMLP